MKFRKYIWKSWKGMFSLFLVLSIIVGQFTTNTCIPLAANNAASRRETPSNPHIPSSAKDEWQGDKVYFGKWKGKPLQWKVLQVSNGSMVLMTDCAVNNFIAYQDVNQFDLSKYYTYEESTIRQWLNGEFLTTAFSNNEEKYIETTHVVNGVGTHGGVECDSGADTYDKVYLLSDKEMLNSSYGFWSGSESAKSRCFSDMNGRATAYWARTVYSKSSIWGDHYTRCVYCDGKGGLAQWYLTDQKSACPVIRLPVSCPYWSMDGNSGDVSEPGELDEAHALMLTSAIYEYGIKTVNVVNTAHSIETSHKPFDLHCNVEDENIAKKYVLYSGKTKIAESSDGNFIDINPSGFESGEKVLIHVIGKEKTVITELLLEVKEKKVPFISNLQLGGDALEFTLDDSVPLIRDREIKLNFPEVPVNAVIEDGKIKVGINMKTISCSWDSNDGVTTTCDKKKTMKQKVEEWIKDIKETGKINKHYQNYINNQLDADLPLMKEKVKFTVFGYLEGEFSDSFLKYERLSGELVVAVSGDDTFQSTILVLEVIPVTVNCKLSVEGAVNGTAILDLKDFSWSGSLDYNSSIGIEPFVGIGAGTWLSYGVYGNLKLGLDVTLLSSLQSSGLDNLYFSGEFGTKAYFAKKEVHKQPVISSKLWKEGGLGKYVNDKGQLLLYSRTEENLYDDLINKKVKGVTKEYYLNYSDAEEFVWNEDESSVYHSSIYADTDTQFSALVENAYGAADPQIITAGNTTLIVYVDNDESRALPNQTVLKYVTYDNASGRLSEPKIIFDDRTADFKPYLYTDSKDIYVYYLNSTKIYGAGEDPDISDYAGSFSISTAKYNVDSDTFTELGTLGSTDSYCYAPVLTSTDDGLLMAWVENPSNHVFGLTKDNSVNYSVYSNGQWSAQQCIADNLNGITSLTVGNLQGKMQIAYCEDIDNDLSTEMFQVYLADMGGNITEIMQDSVSNIQIVKLPGMEQNVLAFNDNGVVSYINAATNEKQRLFDENVMDIGSGFRVEGNRISYLRVSGENGRNIGCMVYTNGEWGGIDFTSEANYIDWFSVSGGKMVYLATEADLSGDEIITNSCIKFSASNAKNDLSMDNINFEEDNLKPDSDLTLVCTITNNGTSIVENPVVTLYDESNQEVLQQQTLNVFINPGSTIQGAVNFKMPSSFENVVYGLRIEETGKTDSHMEDNSITVDLSKTELDVSTEYRVTKEGKYIIVNVANTSNVPTVADVTVTTPDGEALITIGNQEIPANETVQFHASVEDVIPDGASDIVLTASAKTSAEEYYQTNNICEQRIWKIDWSEPVILDNEIKIQNITLSLTNASLNANNSLQLKAEIIPENATNKNLKWSSDNEQVATVDDNGLVTAVGTGKATIIAESRDGSGASASCVVTVTKSDSGGTGGDSNSGGTGGNSSGGSTGGNSSGGSSSSGGAAGGNSSGGNPSGGNSSSGGAAGGNSSGGNPSGGSSSSGGAAGGNSSGGNTSGNDTDNSNGNPSGDNNKPDDSMQIKLLYYIIEFNANAGTKLSRKTMTLLNDDNLGILPKVQREDYIFNGWYTQKSGGTKVNSSTVLNAGTTLFAQWTKVEKPSKVKALSLKSKKAGQLVVSFQKVTGAEGYETACSTNKRFPSSSTKKTASASVKKTVKKLKSGKKYYVKVRAYKVDSTGKKIYGAYSKTGSKKVK